MSDSYYFLFDAGSAEHDHANPLVVARVHQFPNGAADYQAVFNDQGWRRSDLVAKTFLREEDRFEPVEVTEQEARKVANQRVPAFATGEPFGYMEKKTLTTEQQGPLGR